MIFSVEVYNTSVMKIKQCRSGQTVYIHILLKGSRDGEKEA